tara:strand:- start:195 stop:434 length:240 start_codon:yes stop_codon:yes gene_type:complete
MTLKEQYKKETNLEVYILDPFTGDFDNSKYVEWLEAKINYTHCCTVESEQLKIQKTTKKQRVQLNEGYNKKKDDLQRRN